MKKLIPFLSIFILHMFVFIGEVMAQTPPPTPPAAGAPLDGFTALLLAGGIGYGAGKMYKNRKGQDKP